MVLNTFTHAAADNWNRATDSVTGKHLDIINLVMFQSYKKAWSLVVSITVLTLQELHFQKKESDRPLKYLIVQTLQGNNIGLLYLKNRLNLDWYFVDSLSQSATRDIDRAWIFLRICLPAIFEIQGTELVHVPNFGGLSGSEDRSGGDNRIQFIIFGRVGDKSFKEWRQRIGGWKGG